MKLGLILFFSLSLAGIGAAQDQDQNKNQNQNKDEAGTPAKRVSSITWDMQNGKLIWVVESGVTHGEDFTPSSQQRYEITPEQAMMAVQGEQRGFTQQEANWLQSFLHVLTIYCAESTVWWDEGAGVPLDHGKPSIQHPTGDDQPTTPQKVSLPVHSPGSVRLVALRTVH